LTAEGGERLECDAVANVVDIYFATDTVKGRPKSARPFEELVRRLLTISLTNLIAVKPAEMLTFAISSSVSSFRDEKAVLSQQIKVDCAFIRAQAGKYAYSTKTVRLIRESPRKISRALWKHFCAVHM
jgi:hypothetical protein